jgi:hypothetical protein
MDPRCPRGLKRCPKTFCPLAVQRLKAIRYADKELTEEEEENLPGCPWAISSQMHNYCFFKYLQDGAPNRQLSDVEIAHLVGTSIPSVKSTEKTALNKLKDSNAFEELNELHTDSDLFSEFDSGE